MSEHITTHFYTVDIDIALDHSSDDDDGDGDEFIDSFIQWGRQEHHGKRLEVCGAVLYSSIYTFVYRMLFRDIY